jgi:hypothetical protein
MSRIETIGNATLSRYQRYRLRKKGIVVETPPRKRGYRQSVEHIEKRKRTGEAHYNWAGNAISEKGGRKRALRLHPKIGPCINCGNQKAERHHKDGNTANNDPSNITPLCRRCHMDADGRLASVRARFVEMNKCAKK